MVITFGVLFSSVAMMTIYISDTYLDTMEDQLFKALIAKGSTLVVNNSQAMIGIVSDNSVSEVSNLVSATVKNDSAIVYGIFMDDRQIPWVIDNHFLTHQKNNINTLYYQISLKKLDDKLSLWAANLTHNDYLRINSDSPPFYAKTKTVTHVYEFSAPIYMQYDFNEPKVFLGTIRYGISTLQMEMAKNEA
jgi:hypothetical protein